MQFLPKYFLFLIGIVFTFSNCSQNNNENVTVKYELNKGYFLQSTSSSWISKYYDYVEVNESPSIAVAEKQEFGAIDKNDNIIIPLKYKFVETFNSVILAHPYTRKHDLYSRITAFDHSGKQIFSQELLKCIPISDHLIACDKNLIEGVIFNLKGEELYTYNAQEKVREILPNIIEFKSKEGELQYIDNLGNKVSTPKYLPLYLTYKNYEDSDYMVVRDQDGTQSLLDKNNETINLPDEYIAQGVKYDFAILKRQEEEREKYFIYDIKNEKLLDNTSSQQFINIHKCDQGGSIPTFFFYNIYNYKDGKREYKYVNESNETLRTYGQPDPGHRVDEEKYIQNFCDPSAEKYFFKRRIANSKDFACYEGVNDKIYFKNKNTEEILEKDNLFLKYGSESSYDKYSIVYKFESDKKLKKYGVVNSNFEVVIPLEYSNISKVDFAENKFFLYEGNKMGMTDSEANIILEPKFDKIEHLASSIYKNRGILITTNENKYRLFSFAGLPLDDELYTSKAREKHDFVMKPLILSNEKTKTVLQLDGRISRSSK